jgi:enoyl-CoA hydratase
MHVTTTIEDHIATITMDDGKVNALSPSMQAELNEHLDEVDGNDAVKAVVLSGRDGVFSAGFDLAIMGEGDMKAIVEMVAGGGELVRRLYGFHVPVIAAANGHAIAAGAFTLLGCDVRVGTTGKAKIGMNEVAIGMAVPNWAITIASHRLSNRHLNRSLLNARLTDGAGALDVGFLDVTVDGDDVIPTAIAEAHALAASLDPSSYVEMIRRYRGDTLDTMAAQIAADRASVS